MRKSRYSLVVMAFAFVCTGPWNASATDQPTAAEALQRLVELKGKAVRLVIEDIDGQTLVSHMIVGNPVYDRGRLSYISPGPSFNCLPQGKRTLLEDYRQQHPERKQVRSVRLTSAIRVEGRAIKSGRHLGTVVQIEELDITGPPIESTLRLEASRVDDAFVSKRAGGFSAWQITATDSTTGQARVFRLLNSNYRSAVLKRNALIKNIALEKPAWRLTSSGDWQPAVRFTVTYDIPGFDPTHGWFVLDPNGMIQEVEYRNYKELRSMP